MQETDFIISYTKINFLCYNNNKKSVHSDFAFFSNTGVDDDPARLFLAYVFFLFRFAFIAPQKKGHASEDLSIQQPSDTWPRNNSTH